MPATLTLRAASIVTDTDAAFTDHQLYVREGIARIKPRRTTETLLERAGVVGIERPARNLYSIRFADGSHWEVTAQGCGCGS